MMQYLPTGGLGESPVTTPKGYRHFVLLARYAVALADSGAERQTAPAVPRVDDPQGAGR